MLTTIKNSINNRILDYRYKVHSSSGICLTYYLIMSFVPMCSLFAYIAALLGVDLSLLEVVLQKYLTDEFASAVIQVLTPTRISLSSILVIVASIFIASRGTNQLYSVSKNLFPPEHDRHFLFEQIILMFKTIFVFVILIIMIAILTFFPMLSSIFSTKGMISFDDVYLFLIFFILLTLLYKIIPDAKVQFVDVIKGSSVAALLLSVLLACLEFYFRIADYNNIYGPLSSIVVVMISFTMIAEVIYIGMYLMFEAHMKRLIIEMTLYSKKKARES